MWMAIAWSFRRWGHAICWTPSFRHFTPLMATVQKVARAAKAAFKADGVQIRQYNEPAAGQTVFHLHFHIMPLNEGQAIRPHAGKMADQALLAKQAEMIRSDYEGGYSGVAFARIGFLPLEDNQRNS